jgi:predicted 3-demethylubiquinone-9 3-methyltransferase (glyoxalase superfamily)
MAKQIRPHLMFDGSVEEAMKLYVSLISNSEILETNKYDSGENKGELYLGRFTLGGREFLCIDSPIKHEFGFAPAVSIHIDCETSTELERLFVTLSEGGEILMPLDNYGFSTKFGWLSDRFGVSWQLDLR